MARGFGKGVNKVGFMSFRVDGEGTEKFLGLVQGFFVRDGSFDPVDCGVEFFKPGES